MVPAIILLIWVPNSSRFANLYFASINFLLILFLCSISLCIQRLNSAAPNAAMYPPPPNTLLPTNFDISPALEPFPSVPQALSHPDFVLSKVYLYNIDGCHSMRKKIISFLSLIIFGGCRFGINKMIPFFFPKQMWYCWSQAPWAMWTLFMLTWAAWW